MDPLTEVVVEKLGTTRPARVRVRFVAEQFEAREEWVPPARLKVPWSQVSAYEAREARWKAVASELDRRDTPEELAASTVFDMLINHELVSLEHRSATEGVSVIHDLEKLAQFLALEPQDLTGSSLAFKDDNGYVVPWSVTELIARTAAARDPQPILSHVDADEAEATRNKLYGKHYVGQDGRTRLLEPEYYQEQDESHFGRPYREVLRSWCGQQAVERRDELKELRKEVARLSDLVLAATAALRRAGDDREARRIERAVGVTVEELRRR
ncbi:hypothetical protein [Georgenia ruanii]|uniref:PE-PGRS family protein n=1 Tax=Georgenia ruanii TaxID=348442 RepID=A0A7J9UZM9_9MICO|nr:hypothetical protein [Georgenia ruanii]MPV89144.1 hypothetical protein [Georgenia ruanii]